MRAEWWENPGWAKKQRFSYKQSRIGLCYEQRGRAMNQGVASLNVTSATCFPRSQRHTLRSLSLTPYATWAYTNLGRAQECVEKALNAPKCSINAKQSTSYQKRRSDYGFFPILPPPPLLVLLQLAGSEEGHRYPRLAFLALQIL